LRLFDEGAQRASSHPSVRLSFARGARAVLSLGGWAAVVLDGAGGASTQRGDDETRCDAAERDDRTIAICPRNHDSWDDRPQRVAPIELPRNSTPVARRGRKATGLTESAGSPNGGSR
jgi:hypothetical protein